MSLTRKVTESLIERGFSRRQISRIAMGAAAAFPLFNEFALAQQAADQTAQAAGRRGRGMGGPRAPFDPDVVRITSNENPMGPCKEGLEALMKVAPLGWRYSPQGDNLEFMSLLASTENVPQDHVTGYPGSSIPLAQCAFAFTSPTRSWVCGGPGYSAGVSRVTGAKAVKVPLRADFSHDVEAMIAADPNGGAYYICNPNNPTGTLTPKSEIEWLVANKPKGSVVLVDEAYTHLSEAPFNADLVAADKDVVVLRTFSKIYGMAGLRAGAALAKPELLQKLGGFSSGMLPITGMVAATASLQEKDLVPKRRKIIAGVREDTFNFLEKNKFHYVPSVSNCFMVDTKQDGKKVGAAMVKEKVVIGRVWPVWPTYVRVTVGTADEMKKFQAAFLKVMSA